MNNIKTNPLVDNANKIILYLTNVPILYPLKTPENHRFYGAFRVIKWGHWPKMSLYSFLISLYYAEELLVKV